MPKKKTPLDRFADLTWNDLEEWAGSRIVGRGRNYQIEGLVSDLAVTGKEGLIAWVDGTTRYASYVAMGENGLSESICTCPCNFNCKHGVALVLEYLEKVEKNQRVPKAKQDDVRLGLLLNDRRDDALGEIKNTISEDVHQDIDAFLKGKTKTQLMNLIHELATQYPELAIDLSNRKQLISGNVKTVVTSLRKEIRDIGYEPGWQNYWNGEGFTPDYSGIRKKLIGLFDAGHADEVLTLGRELVSTGIRQVEESHDEGETAMEVAACMPVIVKALDQSSLDSADKLNWALDAELEDQYNVCEVFAEYLHRRYSKAAWHTLADRMLLRLKEMKHSQSADDFNRMYERDRLSDWAIHALDRAGRKDEIIPLCIAEAKRTDSYDRLVKRLVAVRRYEDAEHWIHKGIQTTMDKLPGIASSLRNKLQEIRMLQKNWPAVAAIEVEEFVRRPSRQAFTDCRKAAGKVKAWTKVRKFLLNYLEKGEPPWKQKGWPLPASGLGRPGAGKRNRFPLLNNLIDIAILEKKPEHVLKWYDQRPKSRFGWSGVDQDTIATAVQAYAPDRAVSIWQDKAEGLIAQVKPKAYQEAAKYLRKAAKIMRREKKTAAWEGYLKTLREQHIRKRRLMEILDDIDDKPIVKNRYR